MACSITVQEKWVLKETDCGLGCRYRIDWGYPHGPEKPGGSGQGREDTARGVSEAGPLGLGSQEHLGAKGVSYPWSQPEREVRLNQRRWKGHRLHGWGLKAKTQPWEKRPTRGRDPNASMSIFSVLHAG